MRVGFEGEGQPIPLDALPGASELGELPTQTLLLTEEGFKAEDYIGLGYTHYEVMCIGAVGGQGGSHEENGLHSFGGGGGGGGLHIVSGLLVALPPLVEVIIGEPGVNGTPYVDPPYGSPSNTPPTKPGRGGDGGFSSFNGDTCVASGGKGGYPTPQGDSDYAWLSLDPEVSVYYRPGGKGGEGGVGGQEAPGGGAEGADTVYTPPPAPPQGQWVSEEDNPNNWSYPSGKDGSWDGAIGKGGGGGLGGTHLTTGFDYRGNAV